MHLRAQMLTKHSVDMAKFLAHTQQQHAQLLQQTLAAHNNNTKHPAVRTYCFSTRLARPLLLFSFLFFFVFFLSFDRLFFF